MSSNLFTQQQEKRIVDEYVYKNMTIQELADYKGCSKPTIFRILKQNNAQDKRKKFHFQLYEIYKNRPDLTYKELAKKIGMHPNSVAQAVRKNRKPGEEFKINRLSHIDFDKVCAEYDHDTTIAHLSEKYGLSKKIIRKELANRKLNQTSKNSRRMEVLLDMWNSDKTVEEMSTELNMNKKTITSYVSRKRSQGYPFKRRQLCKK